MRGKIFIILMCFFCFATVVSATATIEIKTLPNHEIFITEIDAFQSGDVAVKSPLRTFSGNTGKISIEYTPKKTSFKLGLLLKNGTRKVIGYTILKDIFHDEETAVITFLPDGFEWEDIVASVEKSKKETEIVEETNETEIITNETIEEINLTQETEIKEDIKEENETGIFKGILINGYTVIQENKSIVNVLSYFFGAAILVAPVYFLLKRRKNKKGLINMVSDKFNTNEKKGDEDEEAIKKAEEDLKKAKERIGELKGKKIEAAKRKLIEDEKELLRLKNLGKEDDE